MTEREQKPQMILYPRAASLAPQRVWKDKGYAVMPYAIALQGWQKPLGNLPAGGHPH